MKKIFLILIFALAVCSISQAAPDWQYRLGGSSKDQGANTSNKINFARAMGYDYITMSSGENNVGTSTWAASPSGLYYYIIDPHHFVDLFYGSITSQIDDREAGTYTAQKQDWIQANMIIGTSANAFPNNIVHGWHYSSGNGNVYDPCWCFQQQSVITNVINGIMNDITAVGTTGFTFAGYVMDITRLYEDVHLWYGGATHQVTTLDYGSTSCAAVYGTRTHTHTFSTVEDGMAQFYIQLNNRIKATYGTGNVHAIAEPWNIWHTTPPTTDEFINRSSVNQYASQLGFDQYLSESSSDAWITQSNNFSGTPTVLRSQSGSVQAAITNESWNRYTAALCGTPSASYLFDMQFLNYSSITQMENRNKLIRSIVCWDKYLGVPRTVTNNNGTISVQGAGTTTGIYSMINNMVYYGRNPKLPNRIYAAVGTTTGTISIGNGETFLAAYTVDNLFQQATATSDFVYDDTTKTLSIAGTASINGTWNGTASGYNNGSWTGYLIDLGTVSASQSVSTGNATDYASQQHATVDVLDYVFRAPLRQGTSTAVRDVSVNQTNGTITGATWASNIGTRTGNCLYFDGDDNVNFNNQPIFQFGTDTSISYMCWVNPVSFINNFDGAISKGGSSASNKGFDIELGNGIWSANIVYGTGTSKAVTFAADGTPYLNKWTHLAAIVNRNNQNLLAFLNGIQVGTVSISVGSGTLEGSNALRIGCVGTLSNYFNGYISDARIYQRALSSSEVMAIYNATK